MPYWIYTRSYLNGGEIGRNREEVFNNRR
jgi:hypothetical protein